MLALAKIPVSGTSACSLFSRIGHGTCLFYPPSNLTNCAWHAHTCISGGGKLNTAHFFACHSLVFPRLAGGYPACLRLKWRGGGKPLLINGCCELIWSATPQWLAFTARWGIHGIASAVVPCIIVCLPNVARKWVTSAEVPCIFAYQMLRESELLPSYFPT